MDDYTSKPVRPKDLLEALARWGDRGPAVSPAREETAAAAPGPRRMYDGRLRDSYGLNEECEREVIEEFLTSTEERLERIGQLLDTGTCDGVQIEAHTVKGSARTLGVEELGSACEAIETGSGHGDIEVCRQAFRHARAEFATLREELLAYLKRAA